MAPASAGVRPAISRSKLDLPLPFAPVSTSAPPVGTAKPSRAKTSRSPRRQASSVPVKDEGDAGWEGAGMPGRDDATGVVPLPAKKRTAPAGGGGGRGAANRRGWGETVGKNEEEPISSRAPLGNTRNATRFRWNRGETV